LNSSGKDETDGESVIAPHEVWERLSEEEKDSVREAMIRIAEEMNWDNLEDASKLSSNTTDDRADEDN
jgi:TRAP-type C4-dicarboxylate transport system substrate-binding protein